MNIRYILGTIITIVILCAFMTYIAFPVMVLAAVWFIFRELKRRFFPSFSAYGSYQKQQNQETLNSGKIIDVEFHEVQ